MKTALLLVLTLFSVACAANDNFLSSEFVMSLRPSANWCFHLGEKSACLADKMEISSITDKRVNFVGNRGDVKISIAVPLGALEECPEVARVPLKEIQRFNMEDSNVGVFQLDFPENFQASYPTITGDYYFRARVFDSRCVVVGASELEAGKSVISSLVKTKLRTTRLKTEDGVTRIEK